MRAFVVVLVAATASLAAPPATAQGQCTTLDVQEQSAVGSSIRPEADEYRARLTFRSQPCGLPALPGGGCQTGTQNQVTFEVTAPKSVTANVTPKQASFSGTQAQSTLRLAVAMTRPNETFEVTVSATCAGSRASRGLAFVVADLYRVAGRAVAVRTTDDSTAWRVSVESTGNAPTSVRFEGVSVNDTDPLVWDLPEPVRLGGRFSGGTPPNATTVTVRIQSASQSGIAILYLRPGRVDGDNRSFQDAYTVPLSLIEFRGASPAFDAALALLVVAFVAARRR